MAEHRVVHRRYAYPRIHPHRRGVNQKVEAFPFRGCRKAGEGDPLEGGAGDQVTDIHAEGLPGGQILLAHGAYDPGAGQGGLTGKGAAYPAAAEQRHPSAEGDAGVPQGGEEAAGVGVVANRPFRGEGDGVDRPVELRPAF